jgi:F0F1-type ATP synthase gamma subunit
MESFDMIMRYLIQFEQIVVFHGQFKTILSQDPTMTPVSGEALEVKTTDDGEVAYLFEPSVEDIARIFEGEILASIFEQTLHESMLAKFASRMLTLDRSIDSIEKRLTKVKSEERIINHKIRNRKQLNTISGISLWS